MRGWAGLLLCSTVLTLPAMAQESGQAKKDNKQQASQVGQAERLPVVIVRGGSAATYQNFLGGGDKTAIGTIILTKDFLATGGSSSGDVNEVLKILPNMQYENHTAGVSFGSSDGSSTFSEQDLMPLLVSISGGLTSENNFMLDGVEINNIAGSPEGNTRYGLKDRQFPVLNGFYKQHTQMVFVPKSIVEQMEVHDSAVSAEFGRFLGGVVQYHTISPDQTKWRGGIEAGGTSSALTQFNLATSSGTNPLNVKPTDFRKYNGSFYVTGPITDGVAILASISNQYAGTTRDRAPHIVNPKKIETDTNYTTGLVKLEFDKDWGKLTFQNTTTFYDQKWESYKVINSGPTSIVGNGTSTQVNFQKKLNDWKSFSDLRLNLTGSYTTSQQGQDQVSNSQISRYKAQRDWRSGFRFVSPHMTECRDLPTERLVDCSTGGTGDRFKEEQQITAQVKVDGKLFGNNFKMGGTVRRVIASYRQPEDIFLYAQQQHQTRAGSPLVFTCDDPNDPHCFDNSSYSRYRHKREAFDATAQLVNVDIWGQYDIKYGKLTLSPGFRVDFDSYLKNTNFSPRIKASADLASWLTVTTSVGKYYDNNSLEYALEDKMPAWRNYSRRIIGGRVSNEEGGNGWVETISRDTNYRSAGLRTPYSNEFAAAAHIKEPLLNGDLRLKFIKRHTSDLFITKRIGGVYTHTNDGKARYTSVSLEYAKAWEGLNFGPLDSIGIAATARWESRHRNADNSFEDIPGGYIWYKNKSYTRADFNGVTGNMDIPIKLGFGVASHWFDHRVKLWANATLTMPYNGVVQSGWTRRPAHDTGNSTNHRNMIDKRYNVTAFVNVGGSYKFLDSKYGTATIEAKVDNVFNAVGNSFADTDDAFKKGRRLWLGMKATF